MKIDTLNNLNIDEEALVLENNVESSNKQNLINLGVGKGNKIKCLYVAPFKNPKAYIIKNVMLAIRDEDSKKIMIARKKNGSY